TCPQSDPSRSDEPRRLEHGKVDPGGEPVELPLFAAPPDPRLLLVVARPRVPSGEGGSRRRFPGLRAAEPSPKAPGLISRPPRRTRPCTVTTKEGALTATHGRR